MNRVSPFVRTSRLVIDMTMRKAKHLEPCSMRDLVMLQTIVRSQPHTPITHSDRHHKKSLAAHCTQISMRKAKHLEPCSMRDLVMLQTIVRSQPHTPITHSDRHHKKSLAAHCP